jgi:hypothetical protein
LSYNYIIPVSNGLFDHKERIGPAIWEFLWLIDRIASEEINEAGERLGLVLGGAPVKLERIAKELHSGLRTVKRNIALLKNENYIETIRVPYGEIIKVRNNKKEVNEKRSAKNGTSPPMADQKIPQRSANNGTSEGREVPNLSERSAKNGTSNKDFKKDLITTITREEPPIHFFDLDPSKGTTPLLQIIDAFCKLHGKLEFHVRVKEREIMGKMIAGGVLSPFIIQTMTKLYDEKRKREEVEGGIFEPPNTFKYYEKAVYEAWRNENTITVETSSVALGHTQPAGESRPRTSSKFKLSRQEMQTQQLMKEIQEDQQSEQNSSETAIFDYQQHVPQFSNR